MADFKRYFIRDLKLAGRLVGFDLTQKKILLGDDIEISPEEWSLADIRIRKVAEREGWMKAQKQGDADRAAGSSSFLSVNLKRIHSATRGYMKAPPWPLSMFYDYVVTRQEYHSYFDAE